jgi:hypothetical protein
MYTRGLAVIVAGIDDYHVIRRDGQGDLLWR